MCKTSKSVSVRLKLKPYLTLFTAIPCYALSARTLTKGITRLIYAGTSILTPPWVCRAFIYIWKKDKEAMRKTKSSLIFTVVDRFSFLRINVECSVRKFLLNLFITCITMTVCKALTTVAKVTSGTIVANAIIAAWRTGTLVHI